MPLFVLSLLTLAAQTSASLPDDVAFGLADWLESACSTMSGEKWHRHGEAMLSFTFTATRPTAKPMYLCRWLILGLPENGATTAKPLQALREFCDGGLPLQMGLSFPWGVPFWHVCGWQCECLFLRRLSQVTLRGGCVAETAGWTAWMPLLIPTCRRGLPFLEQRLVVCFTSAEDRVFRAGVGGGVPRCLCALRFSAWLTSGSANMCKF